MGRGKTKPAESPQSLGADGETNGPEVAQPQLLPQPMSGKQRRLARRRRRQLKKFERQLLARRSRLRPRLFRKAVRLPHEQLAAVVEEALARSLEREREGLAEQAKETIDEHFKEISESLEREREGLAEQAKETIDEHFKEISESLERRQREAEKRIIVRTERSLEQMAESASKRLNREAARLRSELRSGTPSKVSRGGEQSVELTERTIEERLEAMNQSWQQEAEMRIIDRTERSLDQMAQSASKRLNRETARLRSELRSGTPSKVSPERDRQS
jgi:hypothetical protein